MTVAPPAPSWCSFCTRDKTCQITLTDMPHTMQASSPAFISRMIAANTARLEITPILAALSCASSSSGTSSNSNRFILRARGSSCPGGNVILHSSRTQSFKKKKKTVWVRDYGRTCRQTSEIYIKIIYDIWSDAGLTIDFY